MKRIRLTESNLRNMIREAVAGYLNEYYNSGTGTVGNDRKITTGRGNTFRLDKNDPLDNFDLEKPQPNNKFNLQKENRLRNIVRSAVNEALSCL